MKQRKRIHRADLICFGTRVMFSCLLVLASRCLALSNQPRGKRFFFFLLDIVEHERVHCAHNQEQVLQTI
jgi:hypothetical protein